jgi:hypothetical protein
LRQAIDANSGQEVDLVELAAARGAVAVEVADVFAAVELLTGKTLPRPVPVEVEAMAPPPSVLAALDRQYEHWHALIVPTWPQVLTLASSPAAPGVISGFARQARSTICELAEQPARRGQGRRGAAADQPRVVRGRDRRPRPRTMLALAVAKGDIAGATRSSTQAEELATSTDQALAAIGDHKPDTMGGHLQLMSAFRLAITGWAFRSMASHRCTCPRRGPRWRWPALPASRPQARQQAAAHRAGADVRDRGRLDRPRGGRAGPRGDDDGGRGRDLARLQAARSPTCGASRRRSSAAAASNLAYLDALFVADLAKAQRQTGGASQGHLRRCASPATWWR